jgi:genome maintenance exonuclease 1
MYKPKFNYESLRRETVNGKRNYVTTDGSYLPSVTTILDATKSEEKKNSLNEWRKKVGFEKAQKITNEAANRGTKMHLYLEHYVKDGKLKDKPSNIFHHPSWFMADSVIRKGLVNCNEFWGLEVPLYFPDIYAGTTDCVGIHNGIESIIDFKQTNKPKKREWIEDYFLQLCAYANAHNEVHGTNINRGVIMMCVKPVEDNNGLIIEPPVYQEFILEDDEFRHYDNKWWKRVEEYYTKFVI